MLPSLRSASAALCALVSVTIATADEFVSGHIKRDGTVVMPYFRSDRDGIFENNWSTKPNIDPHTGEMGTRVTPPNRNAPSYFSSPRPSIVTAPYYGSSGLPSVDYGEAAAAARQVAEASRAAQLAAAAKAYNDAKESALAAAKANSDQRRKSFSRELDAERAEAESLFERQKADIIAYYAQREPAAIESDKTELRKRYDERVAQYDREQAAADQQFKAAIARKREQLMDDYVERQAIAAALDGGRSRTNGEPTLAELLRDEQRTNEQKLNASIESWTSKQAKAAESDRSQFVAREIAIARDELAKRSDRRRGERDERVFAMKSAHDRDVGQRIARLESKFEQAEAERIAADQERAERRFLAYVHVPSIDSAMEAEPVAYNRPLGNSQSAVSGSALTVTVVAGLGLLLVIGAILSARSKPIDFGPAPSNDKPR
jgi:hypothetical protein